MIKFKEIPLHPTLFTCDVIIGSNQKEVAELFHKRYGESVSYYMENLTPNGVESITSTLDSECKGHTRIVLNMQKIDACTACHESVHILHHIAKICKLETGEPTSEWNAYMIEYIFKNIMDKSSYIKINP